eukprot:TRINITY_DN4766_c0_g3_i2.p1 TRINITY_DN4766_c0_g3~~TRINITY_DN4766_c0_g3_i2.p1  ORF type:complete len:952 (+),score=240.87 TRINITY_DN4766_c0_g3_i2:406-2856(+)
MEVGTSRSGEYLETFYKKGKQSILHLNSILDMNKLVTVAVHEVARISGYDRVMAYRFNRDGHGEVVAEKKGDNIPNSFLGLRYPATDIPKQARELYIKNWIRCIPDRSYVPVAILPSTNPLTDEPLDLGFAWSRSVSPIHLVYLKNMGVEASMSISLVVEGKLWGLIVCHNSVPKSLPYEVRVMCEFLGQVLSWHITTSSNNQVNEQLMQYRHQTSILCNAMSLSENWITALLAQQEQLLAMTNAAGAAICYERQVFRIGKTPPLEPIMELVEICKKQPAAKVMSCECLQDFYEPSIEWKDVACGLLATFLSQSSGDVIMWFRPEVVQIVNWAGEGAKDFIKTDTLAPRQSFQLWKQIVSGHCEAWTSCEEIVAAELRHAVLEMIIKQRIKKAHEQERMRAKIAEDNRKKQEEFIDTICHEIRNPINGITGSVELLRDQLSDIRRLMSNFTDRVAEELTDQIDGLQTNIDSIAECAEHQTMITNDVLNISKFDTNKMELVCIPFIVQTVIQQVHRMFAAKISKKGLKLNLVLPETPLVVKGDPNRLKQVVINLVANAIKFTESGGITISMGKVLATAQHKFIQISVEDTGIGMTDQEKQLIFEPVERSSDGTPSTPGSSGLGLSISRKIIQMMKGDMEITTQKNAGSQFSFTIETDRLTESEEEDFLKSIERTDKSQRRDPTEVKVAKKILVVEDNPLNQRILVTILQRNGYVCAVANNGVEAIESFMCDKYDLLFMDVEMPKMDGYEATRQIRQKEKELSLPPVPIICLTGNARLEHKDRAFEAGMSDFVTKPFKKEDVLEKIQLFLHLKSPVVK